MTLCRCLWAAGCEGKFTQREQRVLRWLLDLSYPLGRTHVAFESLSELFALTRTIDNGNFYEVLNPLVRDRVVDRLGKTSFAIVPEPCLWHPRRQPEELGGELKTLVADLVGYEPNRAQPTFEFFEFDWPSLNEQIRKDFMDRHTHIYPSRVCGDKSAGVFPSRGPGDAPALEGGTRREMGTATEATPPPPAPGDCASSWTGGGRLVRDCDRAPRFAIHDLISDAPAPGVSELANTPAPGVSELANTPAPGVSEPANTPAGGGKIPLGEGVSCLARVGTDLNEDLDRSTLNDQKEPGDEFAFERLKEFFFSRASAGFDPAAEMACMGGAWRIGCRRQGELVLKTIADILDLERTGHPTRHAGKRFTFMLRDYLGPAKWARLFPGSMGKR